MGFWDPVAAQVLNGPESVAPTPTPSPVVVTSPTTTVTTTVSQAAASTVSAAGLDSGGGKNGATGVRRGKAGALVIAMLVVASLIL
jgi:hypothetical protein